MQNDGINGCVYEFGKAGTICCSGLFREQRLGHLLAMDSPRIRSTFAVRPRRMGLGCLHEHS